MYNAQSKENAYFLHFYSPDYTNDVLGLTRVKKPCILINPAKDCYPTQPIPIFVKSFSCSHFPTENQNVIVFAFSV